MHIFLTGPKGVGKSTLLESILADFPGKKGGFRTVRLNTFLPGQYTVHLLSVKGSLMPTEENLLFVCGKEDSGMVDRFDRLGCEALSDSEGADLLVMDELGPHEAAAVRFQNAVWNALNGDAPVLGVLQQADSSFLNKVFCHPQVQVIAVTRDNREALKAKIPHIIKTLTKERRGHHDSGADHCIG